MGPRPWTALQSAPGEPNSGPASTRWRGLRAGRGTRPQNPARPSGRPPALARRRPPLTPPRPRAVARRVPPEASRGPPPLPQSASWPQTRAGGRTFRAVVDAIVIGRHAQGRGRVRNLVSCVLLGRETGPVPEECIAERIRRGSGQVLAKNDMARGPSAGGAYTALPPPLILEHASKFDLI